MKRVLLFVAVLLVAGVALTGCSKSTTSSTKSTDTPPAPPTTDSIPEDTAQ